MEAVDSLIRALDDDRMEVREAAAIALGEIRSVRAIRPLCSLLSGYPDGRAAAEALVQIGPAAIDDVASVLLGKADIVDGRETAARVLALIGDPHAVEPLIHALHSPIGFRSLYDPAKALVCIGASAVSNLVAAMRGGDTLVPDILRRIGTPDAMDSLVVVLGDGDEEVRNAAALALGVSGDRRAEEALCAALGSGSKYVRKSAAEALGRIGDGQCFEALVAALKDEDVEVREAVAQAMTSFATPPCAVASLIALLSDRDEKVRRTARKALSNADSAAVAPLIDALSESNARVRRGAAEALGVIGDSRAVEPLRAILCDQDWNARKAAEAALKVLGESPRGSGALSTLVQE